MVFKTLNIRTKTILIIQMISMLMGASTHVMWVLKNGFLSENYNANLFTQLFWDSLTFFDPIAAVLLIIKPKIGVYLTFVIIIIDIIHNNIFYMDELYINTVDLKEWVIKYWMILGQIIFGAFVILTFKNNVIAIKNKS